MIKLLNSLLLFYVVALIPGRYAIQGLFDASWYYAQMMYDSGVWSIRFLLITICISPVLFLLSRLGRGRALGRWLLQRRRHFGLVSFVYAGIHLAHYTLETGDLGEMFLDIFGFDFASGWLAFVLFAALAVTSNTASVRRLGRAWKTLHLWIYPAIGLTFLHWYLFDPLTARVLFWLGLFVGVKLLHGLLKSLRRKQLP
jgi:sulfoxide reductase heme-binding subunit YedZ